MEYKNRLRKRGRRGWPTGQLERASVDRDSSLPQEAEIVVFTGGSDSTLSNNEESFSTFHTADVSKNDSEHGQITNRQNAFHDYPPPK